MKLLQTTSAVILSLFLVSVYAENKGCVKATLKGEQPFNPSDQVSYNVKFELLNDNKSILLTPTDRTKSNLNFCGGLGSNSKIKFDFRAAGRTLGAMTTATAQIPCTFTNTQLEMEKKATLDITLKREGDTCNVTLTPK